MKEILTKDGSITFYNEYYGDVYNSVTGAMEEAREKFVIPCQIPTLAKSGKVKILDVCFGIGYNSLMAINEALKINPDCKIEIVGLENDKAVIEQILKMKFCKELAKEYEYIKKAAKNCLENKDLKEKQIQVRLILDDARKSINEIKGKYDAIFLDPFTPKTCPDMWTAEFITDIVKHLKNEHKLATYSCAKAVRDNMLKAGLKVEDGPRVGRFAPSTIATKL